MSDLYLTLIAQINLRLSNQLVNINHLDLPRQKISSVFRSRQEVPCQVWKKIVLDVPGIDVPTIDVPGTDLPGTDVPGTDVPGTDIPGTA